MLGNISIRNKLITIQAFTAMVGLLICCLLFVFIGLNTFKTSTVKKLNSIARITGESCIAPIRFMDQDAAHNILVNITHEAEINEGILLDRKGVVFATNKGTDRSPIPVPAFALRDIHSAMISQLSGPKLNIVYHIYDGKEFIGTLIIRAEFFYLKKIIKSYLLVAASVMITGLFVALLISYFLQQMISNRLLQLVNKTKEVADTGNYSLRVASDNKDEIGILCQEFNSLLAQIEKMESSLKEANSDLERRVQQRTAELENANKELESFSYTVSHDLKAPLRAINGFTEILVKKYSDKIDDKGKEIANIIVANAKKMGQLIQDLLEFSRIGRKELAMNDVPMDEIVSQVINETKTLYPGRNITINVGKLPPAHGDKNLLTQVWVNFISNAFKYTAHKEKAEITIGSFQQKNDIVYFIKDNGAGFDMRFADKLFRVFQRLHGADEFEGTGVGLAIVSRIITRHGGKVWAEGKPNEGAAFYFSLPA